MLRKFPFSIDMLSKNLISVEFDNENDIYAIGPAIMSMIKKIDGESKVQFFYNDTNARLDIMGKTGILQWKIHIAPYIHKDSLGNVFFVATEEMSLMPSKVVNDDEYLKERKKENEIIASLATLFN